MVKEAIWEKYKKRVHTMEQVNAILPHLTSHDIMILSTLEKVPKAILLSPNVKRMSKSKKETVKKSVPVVYEIDIDGINVASEGISDDLPVSGEPETTNQYSYLGVTGVDV